MAKTGNSRSDPFLGITLDKYRLAERVGEGRIGVVYRAQRDDLNDVLACKIIPEGKLKKGWERELEKVVRLKGVPHVVQFHSYGQSTDRNHRPFTYVFFHFIRGSNLRDFIRRRPESLDLAFIDGVLNAILSVLHACQAESIYHGDLHEGNILIGDPDPRILKSPLSFWVSDFGYGGSHNNVQPKDDFRQLFSMAKNLLNELDPTSLNPRDKILFAKYQEFLGKIFLEVDKTQGKGVGNASAIVGDLEKLRSEAERESAAATRGTDLKEPGDYLWAEALGYRVEEWRNLFVPEFLASQDLLTKNITVLTGARGCGKTMAFRRLTVLMDKIIGEPSKVKGADQFAGFYINCRDFVEAFPWLPKNLKPGAKQQIIQYFHLVWFAEVCKTLARVNADTPVQMIWLDEFAAEVFGRKYPRAPEGVDVLAHVRAFLESEKEKCRTSPLNKFTGLAAWPLSALDFLDRFQTAIDKNVAWIAQLPMFFFLDDYTVPIVTRDVQKVLNPIIFKRRSRLFFKISTEASNSFVRIGLNEKPLELYHDFELLDLATESLHQDFTAKEDLLNKIFKPRIDRHEKFRARGLGLKEVLGLTPYSNNELAGEMRRATGHKKVIYSGKDAFVGMWASDIRIMVQMFTDMLREANGSLQAGGVISPLIQDKCYRTQGSEFLVFAESVRDPSFWERGPTSTKPGEVYGTHLKDIAEAFINVSRFELTKGELISNEGRMNPRQAFRLEIVDKFSLPQDVLGYFEGLIRWHIFLQDWRGKSARGMLTPRLYLNRVLIPYAKLTFSSHDHIHLNNQEFIELLRSPKTFLEYWKSKQLKKRMVEKRVEQGGLFPDETKE